MRYLKYVLPVLVPLIILLLPTSAFPFEALTIVQQRAIAIFILAALCWILEPIPIYATSVTVIVLELLLISDRSPIFFRFNQTQNGFGELLSHKSIMATFADPVIMLFLGGFFLAISATKYRLDVNLARVFLKPFGTKPQYVLLGLMLITAVFSMFMSNTATTAMMLSILAPVLLLFSENDPGKIAMALSIPFAANIGGMGTPIGTPPNAIALKYITGDNIISFGKWMSFAVPIMLILLFMAWFLLIKFFPIKQKNIELTIKGQFLKTPKAIVVYIVFILTILLWMTGKFHHMDSNTVALIPVAIFLMSGIITRDDLKYISWDVLWLVSGGIALGFALEHTGLARLVVHSIPFHEYSPYVVLLSGALLSVLMANFMSNTATATLLLPIMAALGTSMESLIPLGGGVSLVLLVGLSASLGMSLPISTPPNALAHATGLIQTKDMAKVGVVMGAVGLILLFLSVLFLHFINYL